MVRMFLFYTLPPGKFWTACSTGEHHSADELPLHICGFVRLQWRDIVLFVPEAAAAEMSATNNTAYNVCVSMQAADKFVKLGALDSPLSPVMRMISFSQLLQHLYTLIVVQKHVVVSASTQFLFLRANNSARRRSSWASCFVPGMHARVADTATLQTAVSEDRYQPPMLKRTMSGNNILKRGWTKKKGKLLGP